MYVGPDAVYLTLMPCLPIRWAREPDVPENETVTVQRADLDIVVTTCLRWLPDDLDTAVRLAFDRISDARYETPAAETKLDPQWARRQAMQALAGAKAALELAGIPLPRIVCLCGSTRFYDQFQQANYERTMAGEIVLSVGFYPHAKAVHGHGEGVGHDSAEKTALDELHKRKIDLADYVLVVSDETGYFGESTRGGDRIRGRAGQADPVRRCCGRGEGTGSGAAGVSTTEQPGPQLVCPGCGSPDVDLGRGLFCGTCAPVPSPPVAAALERAEAAEAKLATIRKCAETWAALAPADDWGLTPADTVAADCGRAILAIISSEEESRG